MSRRRHQFRTEDVAALKGFFNRASKMKSAVATILAVCFAAATCSAHVLSGKPTVAVAQGLSKDESKLDTEYFLKDLFVKASNHIKEAVRKIKNGTFVLPPVGERPDRVVL
ncbi:hypothetical protein MRX96_021279 [Rhipicephalus microplus]